MNDQTIVINFTKNFILTIEEMINLVYQIGIMSNYLFTIRILIDVSITVRTLKSWLKRRRDKCLINGTRRKRKRISRSNIRVKRMNMRSRKRFRRKNIMMRRSRIGWLSRIIKFRLPIYYHTPLHQRQILDHIDVYIANNTFYDVSSFLMSLSGQ